MQIWRQELLLERLQPVHLLADPGNEALTKTPYQEYKEAG